jgi:hypothetical protein
MSREKRWRVRVAAEAHDVILESARTTGHRRLTRDFDQAMDHLARSGTRATGAKKLKTLDLWEIRVGDHRAYLCLVTGTAQLAVGALVAKRTRKHRIKTLKAIERKVHRWRDQLAEEEQ